MLRFLQRRGSHGALVCSYVPVVRARSIAVDSLDSGDAGGDAGRQGDGWVCFHRMFATTAPGLSVVIGLPVAFVLLSAGVFVGIFILWSRARS